MAELGSQIRALVILRFMSLPIIDVEKVFGEFVEAYGGKVSDKEVAPDKESNADYIFHDAKVVAELKILKEDPFSNKAFLASREQKTKKWIANGLVTQEELERVKTISQLPLECYRDIVKLYTGALRGHVKKANQQIKKTREEKHLSDYKGLLLLVSDGNFLLDPKNIRQSLAELFNGEQYSEINTVVYMTVNVVTKHPNSSTRTRLFTYLWRDLDKPENEVPLAFLQDLYVKWATFYGEVTGIPLDILSDVNQQGISEVDLLKDTAFLPSEET
ncbi:MAG: hypothetical protein ACREBG_29935 [Pyrinomonadaceae bacterium]